MLNTKEEYIEYDNSNIFKSEDIECNKHSTIIHNSCEPENKSTALNILQQKYGLTHSTTIHNSCEPINKSMALPMPESPINRQPKAKIWVMHHSKLIYPIESQKVEGSATLPQKGDIRTTRTGRETKFNGQNWTHICKMEGCLSLSRKQELCKYHLNIKNKLEDKPVEKVSNLLQTESELPIVENDPRERPTPNVSDKNLVKQTPAMDSPFYSTINGEHRLSNSDLSKLMQFCHQQNELKKHCKNASRGCLVNNYISLIDIHETQCIHNISKIKLNTETVEGRMNLFKSTNETFKPFCSTFKNRLKVYFLFKKNTNDDGLKIYVASYTNRNYRFLIRYLSDTYEIIYKISGTTNDNIHRICSSIIQAHGPLINYHITLYK